MNKKIFNRSQPIKHFPLKSGQHELKAPAQNQTILPFTGRGVFLSSRSSSASARRRSTSSFRKIHIYRLTLCCETSTCRSLATIYSALYLFLAMRIPPLGPVLVLVFSGISPCATREGCACKGYPADVMIYMFYKAWLRGRAATFTKRI
jgi:hypothetical protein